jgi:hypothetical protein
MHAEDQRSSLSALSEIQPGSFWPAAAPVFREGETSAFLLFLFLLVCAGLKGYAGLYRILERQSAFAFFVCIGLAVFLTLIRGARLAFLDIP